MAKRDKYTKAQAKRACLACKSKIAKIYAGGFISPDQFIKMSKQFDAIHKKLKQC